MSKKIEHPLAEWPKTKVEDDGRIVITGRYPQPRFESLASFLTGSVAVGVAVMAVAGSGDPMIALGIFIFFIAAYYFVLKQTLLNSFGGNLNIVVDQDQISVGSFMGQKHYSRKLPIEFRIEQHAKALTERGSNTTYRDAIEVVMQYGEKRVPLAAMPQKEMERARQLVLRMQNVCHASQLMKKGQRAGAKESAFGRAPDLG